MRTDKCIYADYQATTPVDSRVLAAMEPHWHEAFGNPHSSDHIVGWKAEKATRNAASLVAHLIGADSDEIIFTSGATEANNLALLGLARHASNQRRRILVSAIEHKCVLGAARTLEERDGFTVEHIPVDSEGRIDLGSFHEMLDTDVLLVSIMAVNNEVGVIQDTSAIASLLAAHGILLHTDAAQSPCAMDVHHLAYHADLISLSGHKMYGPQGVGALYVRRDLHDRIEPLIHGGGQQGGIRSGTLPLPLCVGMGAAASICASEHASIEREEIARLRDTFVRHLREGDAQVALNGPPNDHRHPGNANICFVGRHAEDVLAVLQPHLAASTGAACTSGTPEPSHVLRALGLSTEASEASIRFSFGRFSTEDEIKQAATLVLDALASVSSASKTQAA